MTAIAPPFTLSKLDILRSHWRTEPLKIDGTLAQREWQNTPQMPIPKGFLLVQNDADTLYLGFDLVEDLGNDPISDFFWLMIDVDHNAKPTAFHDILFGTAQNDPNRLGKWLMVSPGACVPTPETFRIASHVRQGFGPSAHSRTPHRIWELAIKLDEIGVKLEPFGKPPVVRFGLHVGSTKPPFAADTPPRAFYDFSHFHSIVLATYHQPYPEHLAGTVIGGVGFIPATKIGTNGLATNDYAGLNITNAAFGGTLNFLENAQTIHELVQHGARTFVVRHRQGVDDAAVHAATWQPLMTTWTNYRWTGTTYVLESFGPTAIGHYRLVDPTTDYSIKSLLFAWNTNDVPNMLHQFELDFYNMAGAKMAAPLQTLTLRVDNRAPVVDILDITHDNTTVAPCDIVDMKSATDEVAVTFRAFDAEGLLENYNVVARYGDDETVAVTSDNYMPHSTSPIWVGEATKTANFRPPRTCAYEFLVNATGRVTNGYYRTQYRESYRNVTLKVPGSVVMKAKAPAAKAMLPFGIDK